MTHAPQLGQRALNRALLARQLLLERSDRSTIGTIEHLVGMQAQAPLAPYVALWSRLECFDPKDLAAPLIDRSVVRASLMRGTVHLATASDCLLLRPLVSPALVRGFRGGFGRFLNGVDLDAVQEYAHELLTDQELTRAELRDAFAARWPDWSADTMAYAASYLVPNVQVTPRGVWGQGGKPALTTIESWLGRPLEESPSIDDVVLRYLAAFGPATVMDIQAWCGLTKLREVVDRLAPKLRTFSNEKGRVLYDVPDAPLPDADTPAPPRFLPEYDNVLLSHDDRTRVIDDGRAVPLPPGNGARTGTLLVDGYFRGLWNLDGSTLQVSPFASLAEADVAAVTEEGHRLLDFLGAGTAPEVVVRESRPASS